MSASPRLGAMASPPRRAHSDGFTGRRESYVGPEGSGPSACTAAHHCWDETGASTRRPVGGCASLRAVFLRQMREQQANGTKQV